MCSQPKKVLLVCPLRLRNFILYVRSFVRSRPWNLCDPLSLLCCIGSCEERKKGSTFCATELNKTPSRRSFEREWKEKKKKREREPFGCDETASCASGLGMIKKEFQTRTPEQLSKKSEKFEGIVWKKFLFTLPLFRGPCLLRDQEWANNAGDRLLLTDGPGSALVCGTENQEMI